MYTRNRAHVDGDAFCVIETGDFLITWSKLHSLLSTDSRGLGVFSVLLDLEMKTNLGQRKRNLGFYLLPHNAIKVF